MSSVRVCEGLVGVGCDLDIDGGVKGCEEGAAEVEEAGWVEVLAGVSWVGGEEEVGKVVEVEWLEVL